MGKGGRGCGMAPDVGLLTWCETLSKPFHVSELQFPHPEKEILSTPQDGCEDQIK